MQYLPAAVIGVEFLRRLHRVVAHADRHIFYGDVPVEHPLTVGTAAVLEDEVLSEDLRDGHLEPAHALLRDELLLTRQGREHGVAVPAEPGELLATHLQILLDDVAHPVVQRCVARFPPLVLSLDMGYVYVGFRVEMMQCRKLKELGLLGPAPCGASQDDCYAPFEHRPAVGLPCKGVHSFDRLVGKGIQFAVVAFGFLPSGDSLVDAHLVVLDVVHQVPDESKVLANRGILDTLAASERDVRLDVLGGEVLGCARFDLPFLVEGIHDVGVLEELASLLSVGRFCEVAFGSCEIVLHIYAELVLGHQGILLRLLVISFAVPSVKVRHPRADWLPVLPGYAPWSSANSFPLFIITPPFQRSGLDRVLRRGLRYVLSVVSTSYKNFVIFNMLFDLINMIIK